MNVYTTEEDIWKILCEHVTPNNIVFIKKNNTCARIKFIHHEYADIVRKNLDGKYILVINKIGIEVEVTNWLLTVVTNYFCL